MKIDRFPFAHFNSCVILRFPPNPNSPSITSSDQTWFPLRTRIGSTITESRISLSPKEISPLPILDFPGPFKPSLPPQMQGAAVLLLISAFVAHVILLIHIISALFEVSDVFFFSEIRFGALCVEIDGSFGESDSLKETGSKKRARTETCAVSSSKACREKQRRDRLNDKFMELGALLEPGRPPKTDKAAILVDAVRMVTQLRSEAKKLKDSNSNLQEKIKELKTEKNELRDEKQRLKVEKEKLEQQLKTMSAPQPGFLPANPSMPAGGNKLVPIISYPGVAMWQFMPPAAVDTSQDHVLRPPVA
ncbi:hypothetical protein SASPL_154378 [Salvia splendens]|uniref:BHLH domain-containing protein n=1 Tax=Salvia splendens TaxID=180675 RepID=A0A8X8YYF5_SALSN|nr:hypothetical protein SASPL_154378 [Salvia splendens]